MSSTRRGRETAGDMVRSLSIVMVLVVAMWFFGQAPKSDEQELRPVDPAGQVASFERTAPDVPVPATPTGWTSTVAELRDGVLRVGWVTPGRDYAEYAASAAARTSFVTDLTGEDAERLDPVQAGGRTWEQYRDADGSLSLVSRSGSGVVVLGTLRSSASLADLQALAAQLR